MNDSVTSLPDPTEWISGVELATSSAVIAAYGAAGTVAAAIVLVSPKVARAEAPR